METAAKDASELQGSAQVGQVNKIKMAKDKQTVQFSSSNNKQYYRYNGKGHNPQNCQFKEAVCHGCNKKGHIVKACRAKQ
jgi:competence protein ComGF